MSMCIPDNYDIYCAYEAEQERQMERLPVCCHCDNPITADFLFKIEGDLWCEECMLDEFRKPVDDFIEQGE